MGQRTQLVLKTKDRFGQVKVKVYHEQWGFGSTMPMLLLNFITDVTYGKQKKYISEYKEGRDIVDLKELKVMSKEKRERAEKELADNSVHNLQLSCSYETTDEYENCMVVPSRTQDTSRLTFNKETKEYWENSTTHRVSKEMLKEAQDLLTWDFDVYNTTDIRTYTGDNNDGLAIVSVEETFNIETCIKFSLQQVA